MKDPRRKLTAVNVLGNGECQTGCPPHYPQYHYEWPDSGLLGAHCAKCGSDYTLKEGKDYEVLKDGKR